MAKDYVPRGNGEFNNFHKFIAASSVSNAVAWGIPIAKANAFKSASDTQANLYKAIANKKKRTSEQVAAHTTGRKGFEKKLRKFVNEYLAGNSNIPDSAKLAMGLNLRTHTKHSRPAIEGTPVTFVVGKGGVSLMIVSRVADKEGRASIHKHSDGQEIAYSIGRDPGNPEKADKRIFRKKAHVLLRLDYADVGKHIYVYTRWVNLRSEAKSSGWSEVAIGLVGG